MDIPLKYLPGLGTVIENSEHMLLWSAFGMMGLMIVLGLISITYSKFSVARIFNTIIFGTIGITWILGFVIMMILHLLEIPLEKMYLTWFALLFTCLTFMIINALKIAKFFDETSQSIIRKKKKPSALITN